jgi:aspartyl-tRNA(Asn)/glutamyl-tRNA(Gln) amidotransferase subunit C
VIENPKHPIRVKSCHEDIRKFKRLGCQVSAGFRKEPKARRKGLEMKMDIEKVAKLARLQLSSQERETFGNQLDQILTYMEQLNRLDTKGIEPTSHAIPVYNTFREDEARPSSPKEEVLGIGPEEEEGHFKVPRIIE